MKTGSSNDVRARLARSILAVVMLCIPIHGCTASKPESPEALHGVRSVDALKAEWYYYTGPPRSDAESLFRSWSEGMGMFAAANERLYREGGANALTNAAADANFHLEEKLRTAMKEAGFESDFIDTFIRAEKLSFAMSSEELFIEKTGEREKGH